MANPAVPSTQLVRLIAEHKYVTNKIGSLDRFKADNLKSILLLTSQDRSPLLPAGVLAKHKQTAEALTSVNTDIEGAIESLEKTRDDAQVRIIPLLMSYFDGAFSAVLEGHPGVSLDIFQYGDDTEFRFFLKGTAEGSEKGQLWNRNDVGYVFVPNGHGFGLRFSGFLAYEIGQEEMGMGNFAIAPHLVDLALHQSTLSAAVHYAYSGLAYGNPVSNKALFKKSHVDNTVTVSTKEGGEIVKLVVGENVELAIPGQKEKITKSGEGMLDSAISAAVEIVREALERG